MRNNNFLNLFFDSTLHTQDTDRFFQTIQSNLEANVKSK